MVYSVLQERIDAVEEILHDNTPKLVTLRDLLRRLPDLARGLCRIQYGKVRTSINFDSLSSIRSQHQSVLPSRISSRTYGI